MSWKQRPLTLEALAAVDDGGVADSFAQHMKRAVSDCEARPGEDAARKVIIEVAVTPLATQEGIAADVCIVCKVKGTVPAHVTPEIVASIKAGGVAALTLFELED